MLLYYVGKLTLTGCELLQTVVIFS